MGARPIPTVLHRLVRAVAGWERGWWMLEQYRPNWLARITGVPEDWNATVASKKYGIAFDALVSEPAANAFPLEDIRVATLLVHAADDRLAPYEHVPPAAARIPGAELVTIASGGHLYLGHAADVRAATTAFIAEQVPTPHPATGGRAATE